MNKLKPRYRDVLTDFYFNETKQDKIAEKQEFSQSYISRIIKKGVSKLRKYLKCGDFSGESDSMYSYSGSGRSKGPILDIQREQNYTARLKSTECKVTKLTPEQLEYYKNLPYEEGKEFLEKVLKGEKVKMEDTKKLIYPEMTKESLQANIEAGLPVNQIAKKYGAYWHKVREKLKEYGLWDKRKIFQSGGCPKEYRHGNADIFAGTSIPDGQAEPVQGSVLKNEPVSTNIVHEMAEPAPVNEATMYEKEAAAQENNTVPEQPKKKLKVIAQTLQGENFKFNIHDDQVDIIAVEGETVATKIYIENRLIRPFLEELGEIAEVIGV